MVTDGILGAVQMLKWNLLTYGERSGANCVLDMLADYDEDQWYNMTEEEKIKWIKNYI